MSVCVRQRVLHCTAGGWGVVALIETCGRRILGMQNENRLAEEEYYVRWLVERGVAERRIGVRLAERSGGMNTGCDVW